MKAECYRLHAVATHITEEHIYGYVDKELQALGIQDSRAKDLIDPIMGYIGFGYGRSTEKELGWQLVVQSIQPH